MRIKIGLFNNLIFTTMKNVCSTTDIFHSSIFLNKNKRQPNPNGCLFKEKVFFTMGVAKNL